MRTFAMFLATLILVAVSGANADEIRHATTFKCECEAAWAAVQNRVWAGDAIERDQIMPLVCEDLRVLRNEVYARHGYTFGNEWVRTQMERDPAYRPDLTVDTVTVGERLTDNDRANIRLILGVENEVGCPSYWHEKENKTMRPPDKRAFAKLDGESTIALDGGVTIQAGEATPAFIIGTVLDGRPVENGWLLPLTCDELSRVEQAVWARHNVWFPKAEDRDFYASILPGYNPVEGMTLETVQKALKSVDQLNLLRVARALNEKRCL